MDDTEIARLELLEVINEDAVKLMLYINGRAHKVIVRKDDVVHINGKMMSMDELDEIVVGSQQKAVDLINKVRGGDGR